MCHRNFSSTNRPRASQVDRATPAANRRWRAPPAASALGAPRSRLRGRVLAGVALVAVFGALAECQRGVAADLIEDARRHVRALNARELSEREAAEKGLLDLGPAALPLLPAINDRTPAEVAERLRRVRQNLLTRQVQDAARASLVTLHADKMPLAEALASISKQTGNPVVDHREDFGEQPSPSTITLDVDQQPFWPTLDKVLDQAGLSVYNFGAERSVYVINRPQGQAPRSRLVSYSGPFRVAPTRFEIETDLQKPANRSLKLFLEISWEPRLKPITLVQPLTAIKATCAAGELQLDGAGGEPEAAANGEHSSVELVIPLVLPPRSVETIATLKGRLSALLAGPPEEFRFSELPVAKGPGEPKRVEQRKAAVMVAIDRVRKNNDAWEVEVRARFDEPGDALESHRGWVFDNEAYLEDAKGVRVPASGYEQTREGRDEVGVKFLFDGPDSLAGWTFVYKTPLAILDSPVEYELHDLPLP